MEKRHFIAWFFYVFFTLNSASNIAAQPADLNLSPTPNTAESARSSQVQKETVKEKNEISKERDAKEVKDAKEIKESKEVRETSEVREQPHFFVGLANALAWPLVVMGLFYLVVRSVSLQDLKDLAGIAKPLLKSVKIAGVEIEFNREEFRAQSEETKASFDELLLRADKEYKVAAAQQELKAQLSYAMREALPRVLRRHDLNPHPENLRATVHVADIVFENYLYQLTDYFPDHRSGGPAGRRFSIRFGIIGRAWRMNRSIGRGDVLQSKDNAVPQLVERWGMTYEEASKSHARQNPADICVILRSEEESKLPIGLLFIDSSQENAFGYNDNVGHDANAIAKELENSDEIQSLSRAVTRVMILLRLGVPRIYIERN